MVKIETIAPGASASILRNGQRQQVFEKQLISYAEVDTLEVTGGNVVYSVDEIEVITKSPNAAPAVPQASEPKPAVKDKIKAVVKQLEAKQEE